MRQKVYDHFFEMFTKEWEHITEIHQKRVCTACGEQEQRKIRSG
jgi:hypothetical protein